MGLITPIRFIDPDGRWPEFAIMDVVHTTLDVAGLVPGLGEVADGVNAVIYLAEGDYGNAALSAAAMIPIAGAAAVAVKLAKNADKAVTAAKAAEKASDIAKAEARAAKLSKVDRSGKDFTKAGKEAVINLNKAKNDGKTFVRHVKPRQFLPKKIQKEKLLLKIVQKLIM